MQEICLVKPTMEYAEDILQFRQELFDAGDPDCFAGCCNLDKCLTVAEWINSASRMEREETCPKGKVPSNVFLALRLTDRKVVGIIDFRHHIRHPILSVWGGHIGYTVRPSERGKGYGKEMLRQNLQNCRQYGLDKVLVTCNRDNIASERTILANGGVFEREIKVGHSFIKRFWIAL